MKRISIVVLSALTVFALTACSAKKPQGVTKIELKKFDQAYQMPEKEPPKEIKVPQPVAVPLPGQLKPLPGHEMDKLPEDALMRLEYTQDHAVIEPPATPEGWINSIARYQFIPGALYRVYTSPGRMTDICLAKGETLLDLSAGDTERWQVKQTESGSGDNRRDHIHLKPLNKGIETNFTVNTDQRVYYVELISTENGTYHSGVSWVYPMSEWQVKKHEAHQSPEALGGNGQTPKSNGGFVENFGLTDPASLNFGYSIDGDATWRPVRVFDNSKKTYIQFAPEMKYTDAPVLFVKSGDDLELTNYRHRGNFYVVDRLFNSAVLTVGDKKHQTVVEISRND